MGLAGSLLSPDVSWVADTAKSTTSGYGGLALLMIRVNQEVAAPFLRIQE